VKYFWLGVRRTGTNSLLFAARSIPRTEHFAALTSGAMAGVGCGCPQIDQDGEWNSAVDIRTVYDNVAADHIAVGAPRFPRNTRIVALVNGGEMTACYK
jgi:hypothetical protein